MRGSVGGCWGFRQKAVCLFRLVMQNIQNVQNGGLEFYLRGRLQANVKLVVFLETKVTQVIYAWDSSGYQVVASETPIAHIGSVAVFFCVAGYFSVEVPHLHGANVYSFQMVLGGQQWYTAG